MTENPCPLCDRPIADTAYVCHGCAKSMARRLLLAGTQWESIEDAIGHGLLVDLPPSTPKATDWHVYLGPWCWGGNECEHTSCARAWRSVTHQRVEPPGAHEDHGPLSFEASDDAWTARNTFTTWARHVEEERGTTCESGTTPAVLAFLARNASWLAHRPEAVEVLDELDAAVRVVERAIDTALQLHFLGPCDVCGRELFARPGKVEVECRPCALVYPVPARRDWMLQQAVDRLETARVAAAFLSTYGDPVREDRVRQWARRGRIVKRGEDLTGRSLYRVGDVLDVLRDTREHGTA